MWFLHLVLIVPFVNQANSVLHYKAVFYIKRGCFASRNVF